MKRKFLTILRVYREHRLVSGASEKFIFCSDERVNDTALAKYVWHK